MNELSIQHSHAPDNARATARRCPGVSILFALASACAGCNDRALVQPIVLPAAAPARASLSFSQVDGHSIAATLSTNPRPGVTTIDLRNLGSQSITSSAVDTSAAGSGASFRLPAPWNGEVRITRPASEGVAAESVFVGIVVQPLLPSAPRRIIYGPSGRVSVRLTELKDPPVGTQIVITSPAISSPASPPKVVGDPVEIAFTPSLPSGTVGVVGLTPWLPPEGAQLSMSVFDPKTKQWSALHSNVSRDGTVFASGPLPGVYALAVAP